MEPIGGLWSQLEPFGMIWEGKESDCAHMCTHVHTCACTNAHKCSSERVQMGADEW